MVTGGLQHVPVKGTWLLPVPDGLSLGDTIWDDYDIRGVPAFPAELHG